MWSLVISIIVYGVAKWWMSTYLTNTHGVEKGFSRSVLAFLFAFSVSWGSGWVIDWVFPSQALNLGGLMGLSSVKPSVSPEYQGAQDALKAISKELKTP